MDKEYWESYYKNHPTSEAPSAFAIECVASNQISGKLYDLGCGNGRDSKFFSLNGIDTTGIEQCEIATSSNNLTVSNWPNIKFVKGDFTSMQFDSLDAGVGYSLYSRFTLHAINLEEESRFFNNISLCKNVERLFVEVRSVNDPLCGQGECVGRNEYVTSHYRRFHVLDELIHKVSERFVVKSVVEGFGYSVTDSEDPCLIRIFADAK